MVVGGIVGKLVKRIGTRFVWMAMCRPRESSTMSKTSNFVHIGYFWKIKYDYILNEKRLAPVVTYQPHYSILNSVLLQ